MGISNGDKVLAQKVRDYLAQHPNATQFQVRAKFGLSEGRLKRMRDNGIELVLPDDKGAK